MGLSVVAPNETGAMGQTPSQCGYLQFKRPLSEGIRYAMCGSMNSCVRTKRPESAKKHLSIVIPAYNEEKRIGKTIERVHSYLSSKGYSFEILVVDDGSTDGTESLVRKLSEQLENIALISYRPNRGKGHAVKKGVLASKGKFVLISDADLSTPIEEADKLLALCEGQVDIAFGSRALPDSRVEIEQGFIRRIMGRTFNLLVRALALPGVRDSQCGFKCLKGEAARDLFSMQVTDGFAFDVELLARAVKQGYRIQEVPIRWLNVASSTVHPFRDAITMLRDLLKVKRLLGI